MNSSSRDPYLRVAQRAIQLVRPLLRRSWRREKAIRHKGAVDLVTETDRRAEELIVGCISAAFPDHLIVAEEASEGAAPARPDADRFAWYIDPLDGTTNFAHSYPHFAVSIALTRGAEALLGIVHDPVRNETFLAVRGCGASLNGRPIQVSRVPDLNDALLATGFPYDRRERTDFYLGFVNDMIRSAQGLRRNGAAALDLCYVACGRLDGFWEWKLHPWDTVAGALIVHEAGGSVTDFVGAPFDPYGEQVLASNRQLHPAMIQVLSRRLQRVPGQPVD